MHRKLGHRATVLTSLNSYPFLALGQVLQMFTVCLDSVSAQQLKEGMVTLLLSNAEVQPFNRGAMLITNSVVLGFVF